MNKIKMGIVGLGWVGCHRHLPAIRRNKAYELVGIHDRTSERVNTLATSLGVLGSSGNCMDDISWLDQVNAVSVATPPMAHYELVRELLMAGKHVITEKPFCMSVEQGRELLQLSKEKNKTLCVVHNFQFATSFNHMMKDLQSGRMGQVRAITGVQLGNPRRRLPVWYEELPLGLFYDESPHLIYLLERLASQPLTLSAVHHVRGSRGAATPASLDAFYVLADANAEHIPVSLHLRFEAPLSEWYLMVMGERGFGMVDIFRDIYIWLPNDGRHTGREVITTSIAMTTQHWWQVFTQGLKHMTGRLDYGNTTVFSRFAESVFSGEQDEYIGAARALRVLTMQHEILNSVVSV